MAQDSPVKRHMRRLKRENTLLHRVAKANAHENAHAKLLLLGVLAQLGGEIVVTAGTITQVADNPGLSAVVKKNSEGTELTISLVGEKKDAPDELPSLYDAFTKAAVESWDALSDEEKANYKAVSPSPLSADQPTLQSDEV